MSRSVVWKSIAGAALTLGAALTAFAILLLLRGLISGGAWAFYLLIYAPTFALLIVPLLVLGRIVWRRAARRDSN
jgi:hypothetical protein